MENIVKWRASYETGVPEMDMQHKRLLDLINVMYRVVSKKEGKDAVENVLREMADYAQVHFHDEEALLQIRGYVEMDSHIALHREYNVKMKELIAEYNRGGEGAVKDIYAFLRHWWLEHIVKEDKRYGETTAA